MDKTSDFIKRLISIRINLVKEKASGRSDIPALLEELERDLAEDIELFLQCYVKSAPQSTIPTLVTTNREVLLLEKKSSKQPKVALPKENSSGVDRGVKANPVSVWCDEYKKKYGINYEIQKRDAGMLSNLAKGRSEEKLQMLFACYLAIDEKLYKDQKHPLSLFFRDLPKVSAAAQTGINPVEENKNASTAWMDKLIEEEKKRANGILQITDEEIS